MNFGEVKLLIKEGRRQDAIIAIDTLLVGDSKGIQPDSSSKSYLLLQKLILIVREGNYSESIEFGLSLLHEAHQFSNIQIIDIKILISKSYYFLGESEHGLDLINKLESILSVEPPNPEIANRRYQTKNIKGNILWFIGMLDEAIQCYNESLNHYLSTKNDSEIATSYNNLGFVYLKQNKLTEAESLFVKSIIYSEKSKNYEELLRGQNNIILIYISRGNYTEAQKILIKSSESGKKYGNKLEIALINHNHAVICQLNNDSENARKYFKVALNKLSEVGNQVFLSRTLYQILLLEIETKNFNEAEYYVNLLEDLKSVQTNKLLEYRLLLGKAIYLRNQSRLNKKMEALMIMEKLHNLPVIDQALELQLIVNISSIYMLEAEITENQEILKEIYDLALSLNDIGVSIKSHKLIIESLVIRSNIEIINGNVKLANSLIHEAQNLSKEHNLTDLTLKISKQEHKMNLVLKKAFAAQTTSKLDEQISTLEIKSYLNTLAKELGLKEFYE
ncbi:MAG: tetratricopeptide repeat protein [Candidatus Kariarchaeaceae archaeon]